MSRSFPKSEATSLLLRVPARCESKNGLQVSLPPLTEPAKQLLQETGYIRIPSLAALFEDPVTGHRPSPKSVYRWVQKGRRLGQLKVLKTPFGLVTTLPWIDEWLAAINGSEVATPLSEARQTRQADQARSQAIEIVNGTSRQQGRAS